MFFFHLTKKTKRKNKKIFGDWIDNKTLCFSF